MQAKKKKKNFCGLAWFTGLWKEKEHTMHAFTLYTACACKRLQPLCKRGFLETLLPVLFKRSKKEVEL